MMLSTSTFKRGISPHGHYGGLTSMVNVSHPATLKRLTEALKFAFDIRAGIQLPFILGHGECETNDEALGAWIQEHLGEDQWVEPGALFNGIASQFQRAIEAWRDMS